MGLTVKGRNPGEQYEALAREFHEAYEELAPSFGYETRRESAVPWEQVPEQNRRLVVAVVERVCGSLAALVEQLQAEIANARKVHGLRVEGLTEDLSSANVRIRALEARLQEAKENHDPDWKS